MKNLNLIVLFLVFLIISLNNCEQIIRYKEVSLKVEIEKTWNEGNNTKFYLQRVTINNNSNKIIKDFFIGIDKNTFKLRINNESIDGSIWGVELLNNGLVLLRTINGINPYNSYEFGFINEGCETNLKILSISSF